MNIGYVLYDYPLQSETWIPLEIEELVMRGHNVKVHRLQYPYMDISDCDFILSHFAHIALKASKFGNHLDLLLMHGISGLMMERSLEGY